MSKKWKVIIPLLAVFLAVNTAFADELFTLKMGYQLLSPDGSIAGTVDGVGQKVDMDRDLDLDDSDNFTAEIALLLGNSRLSLNYLPIEFSGTGTLSVAGTFNGQTFNVNDSVKSEMSIDLYDIGYTYYFLNMDDLPSRIQLGIEVAVKVADAEVSFEDQTLGFVETETVTAPIPTIGARARVGLADFISLTGRIGYLEYDENHFVDAEAQIEFSPVPTLGIYGGYRHFELKIDESDIFIETDFSGPFAGAFFRF